MGPSEGPERPGSIGRPDGGKCWQPQEVACPDNASSAEPEFLPGMGTWIPDAAGVEWNTGEPGERKRGKAIRFCESIQGEKGEHLEAR